MPNCYQLFELGHLPAAGEPVLLTDVDAAICKHLNVEVHPENWCFNWHNVIGLLIALGNPLDSDTMTTRVGEWYEGHPEMGKRMLSILDFMRTRYSSTAWWCHK